MPGPDNKMSDKQIAYELWFQANKDIEVSAEAAASVTQNESDARLAIETEMQSDFETITKSVTALELFQKKQQAELAAQKAQAFEETPKRAIAALQLGVLLDTSGSMSGSADTVKKATDNFCTALKKNGFDKVDAFIVPFSELTDSQTKNKRFEDDLDQLSNEFYALLAVWLNGLTNFQAGAQVLLEKMVGINFSEKKPSVAERVNAWVNTRVPDYGFEAVDELPLSSPKPNTFYIKFDSATKNLQYLLQTEAEIIRGSLPNRFYTENFDGKEIGKINSFIAGDKGLHEELLSYARTQGYIPFAPALLILTDGDANKAIVDSEREDTLAGFNALVSHSKISQIHFIAYGDDAKRALERLADKDNPYGGFSALKDPKVKLRLAGKTQDRAAAASSSGFLVGGGRMSDSPPAVGCGAATPAGYGYGFVGGGMFATAAASSGNSEPSQAPDGLGSAFQSIADSFVARPRK